MAGMSGIFLLRSAPSEHGTVLGASIGGNMKEKIVLWIAWHLPKTLVMWCGFRIGAHATQGEYGTTIVPELSFMDAMKRWE